MSSQFLLYNKDMCAFVLLFGICAQEVIEFNYCFELFLFFLHFRFVENTLILKSPGTHS